jgi:acetolactate synthase-1/2/3 large subunit
MKGAKILIESLKKEGVEVIFGYPGGKVIAIYDELFHEKSIKHYLTRHEQGAVHAAEGYARTTGKAGVCIVTSGQGATNTITGIANAHMDSIPLVVITGQASTTDIGKDSFQEADITGITLPITKHNYLVKNINDLARIVKEAFYIATTGRPGPVLIDIPGDISAAEGEFNYPKSIDLPSYKPTVKGNTRQIKEAIKLMSRSKKPLVIAGGGVQSANATQELRKFLDITDIPSCTTLMGMGLVDSDRKNDVGMPGMHGTASANYAIDESDLLIAIGMRFDDRITGKLSEFAKNARIIHIDIDPAEINKCKQATIPVIGDAKAILSEMNKLLKDDKKLNIKEWNKRIVEIKEHFPMRYQDSDKVIKPQKVVEMVNKFTKGKAIYTTDVGAHQMWACSI